MPRTPSRSAAAPFVAVLIAVLIGMATGPLRADEVVLKNGMRLEGTLVPIRGLMAAQLRMGRGKAQNFPIWMVDTGMQRIFVPNRQIAEQQQAANLGRWEVFKLPPHKREGRQTMLAQIGAFADVTEFDKYGRRRVTLNTPKGPTHVIQGITELNPRYAKVEGLTHQWECGLAISSFKPEVLDAILREATKADNPEDRLAIARFYIQAGLHLQASAELEGIRRDFPDLKDRVEESRLTLRSELARQLLAEIRRRIGAGQHRLAWVSIKQFPRSDMSAAVLRELKDLEAELVKRRDGYERALMRLSDLQGDLDSPDQAAAVEPLRSLLRERLDFESLGRLDAFLQLEGDATLSAAQRLALAYSGWLLGSANAVTDLDQTLRLWQARDLVVEYLQAEDSRRRESILIELRQIEGVSPERIGQMVPSLPPPLETPGIQPGSPAELEAPGRVRADAPVKYTVLLPPEYTPHHAYPLIVALRPAEVTIASMVEWWGGTPEQPGQSQRHGSILVVPDYADLKSGSYDYDAAAHHAVLATIRDARRRFRVDSDRIFLSGHGAGADAAFDIGMSHPDQFAGVIAVNGLLDRYCRWYWGNAKHLPFYIVGGELARGSLTDQEHAGTLNKMMTHGFDVAYAEYAGRGYESYFSEIPRLFEWMALHRRTRQPQELELRVLRATDDRFYWVGLEGITTSALQSDAASDKPKGKVAPMEVNIKVAPGHENYTAIYITSGAKKNTIWLSPELVSFDKRLNVHAGGSRKFSGFPAAKTDVLLEDLRLRGDRELLYWDKVEVE